MNKAFIFDMDGVLINSEQTWLSEESDFLIDIFGRDIALKIGDPIGLSVDSIYDIATSHGFVMRKDAYYELFDKTALTVYDKSSITDGLEDFVNFLVGHKFRLGLVSSSRILWIEHVLSRLSFKDKFECVLSLSARPDLRPKPHPDGYLEAIRALKADSIHTVVLEDSNPGIQAAKASGAFTIGFRQYLVKDYKQEGADIYADNMDAVTSIVNFWIKVL